MQYKNTDFSNSHSDKCKNKIIFKEDVDEKSMLKCQTTSEDIQ